MKKLIRFHTPIRISLLMIFLSYAISVNFFFHTHIVNGVTIVHSHPYSTNDDGEPSHGHTGSELQLIHHLSSFSVTAAIILSILLGILFVLKRIIPIRNKYIYYLSCNKGTLFLRPPPSAFHSLTI